MIKFEVPEWIRMGAAAERARDQAIAERDFANNEITRLAETVLESSRHELAAIRERDALRAALEKYATHRSCDGCLEDCQWDPGDEKWCTCGLAEALGRGK